MTKLPGRNFLKVISIILIVLSAISFWGIVSVAFTFSLELAATLYALLLGVMGIIYHNNGEQAGMLKWLAIVNIGLLVAISVIAFVAGRVGGAVTVLAVEVPITVVYLVGALKNANAATEPAGQTSVPRAGGAPESKPTKQPDESAETQEAADTEEKA
ncbi:MAG: hypothetical protein FWE28_03475 [Oscillospiraceae bacterium]|nr:hypothetical protein [Oscillospiraceae bacterium]